MYPLRAEGVGEVGRYRKGERVEEPGEGVERYRRKEEVERSGERRPGKEEGVEWHRKRSEGAGRRGERSERFCA